MLRQLLTTLSLILALCSCSTRQPKETLTKVILTNLKGNQELITNKQRLKAFDQSKAPHLLATQKLVKVFSTPQYEHSVIYTFHDNGQPHQQLNCINGQAVGAYKEWHANGALKVSATIIKGTADISPSAQLTWSFDGESLAWDESGQLIARFHYAQGQLEGESQTYYHDKKLKSIDTYKKGLLNGLSQQFNPQGSLVKEVCYSEGKQHGAAQGFWSESKPQSVEFYQNGNLVSATYTLADGKVLAKINNGMGHKIEFQTDGSYQSLEFKGGIQNGEILEYDASGTLSRSFVLIDGHKNGTEISYYPNSQKPALSVDWVHDKVQGLVKTWYETEAIESQREMSQNKKQGVSTAWYPDGSIMFIEDYERDLLVKGEYFKKGVSEAVSEVKGGKGTVTLHDENGLFLNKISYRGGRPVE